MLAGLGCGQPDDSDENTVKGLGKTLQNLDGISSLASLDASSYSQHETSFSLHYYPGRERMRELCDLVILVPVLLFLKAPRFVLSGLEAGNQVHFSLRLQIVFLAGSVV